MSRKYTKAACYAIVPQIYAIRRRFAEENNVLDETLAIDHVGLSTADLWQLFLSLYDMTEEDVELARNEFDKLSIVSDDINRLWKDFHKQHAVVRVVPRIDKTTSSKERVSRDIARDVEHLEDAYRSAHC